MWEAKEWGRQGGQDQAGTGNLAKGTKVMCQQPNKGDSRPRLGSGTAPGRLQEEEMKLQTWCDKQDNAAACAGHQRAAWGRGVNTVGWGHKELRVLAHSTPIHNILKPRARMQPQLCPTRHSQ